MEQQSAQDPGGESLFDWVSFEQYWGQKYI